jgi:acetyl esterase/lipase
LVVTTCLSLVARASAQESFTYKTVGACTLKADVLGISKSEFRPVVVWIHGGALMMGNRGQIDRRLRTKLLDAGYTVVSIDYRLAPETKLPAILEDLEDALTWVRQRGPELFHVDARRMAVMGGSAGGYLTLVSGYRLKPAPTVLVSFWGYGDIGADWYGKPDPFYSKQPAVSKEEAYGAIGGPVISESSGRNNRGRFYLYCRQNGIWAKEVAGIDPKKDEKALDTFCPIRNVTAKYPPTLLIHGTSDTDVPYEQSATMAEELKRQGVEHDLITVKDGRHGLAGSPAPIVADINHRAIAFVNKHMGK